MDDAPPPADGDADGDAAPRRAPRRLFGARGVRAAADGLVAASLSKYLTARGFSTTQVGVLVTATLLGSAVVVMTVARLSNRAGPGQVLRWTAVAMVVTGALFATVPWYVALLAVAAAGPLNPSSGDVSAFLPAEQALLPSLVPADDRTTTFARYNLVGNAGAALGGALAGVPLALGRGWGWSTADSLRLVFWAYAAVGAVCIALYTPFARAAKGAAGLAARGRLGPSRAQVRRLAVLFSVDSAAGGLTVSSLVAVWLDRRHHFSLAAIGGILSGMSLAAAVSALAAPVIARRIGLVRTMVFTHLPANALLMLAAFAPSGRTAVACLLARSLLSQLDVPARQSFVMSVVEPSERAAAAAYTNVPRSLATASTPALAGWMLGRSTFGWPLLIGGAMKAAYDLALLQQFGRAERGERAHGGPAASDGRRRGRSDVSGG